MKQVLCLMLLTGCDPTKYGLPPGVTLPSAPATSPAAKVQLLPPASGLYWGAFVGDLWEGPGAREITSRLMDDFTERSGKAPAILNFFVGPTPFPRVISQTITDKGAVPLISWALNGDLNQILDGSQDTYILSFAQQAKQFGKPILLRWGWEMNVPNHPWSGHANGQDPTRYVSAWKYLKSRFDQVGAHNVLWMWCPDSWGGGPEPEWNRAMRYWPGDADWLAVDAYSWPNSPYHPFLEIFETLSNPILSQFARLNRPVAIAETAASRLDPRGPDWIRELNQGTTAYPHIKALLWFDKDQDGAHWKLDSLSPTGRAVRSLVQQPKFVSTPRFALQ